MRESTNWANIGQQLGLLRAKLNEQGNYLWDIYVGAASQSFKVIVVTAYGGGELSDSWYKKHFDYSWLIMQSLEAHIQQFSISKEWLSFLDAIRQKYLAFTDPVIKAIVDLAWSFLSTAKASGGPTAAFFAVCLGGIERDLGWKLRSQLYMPKQGGFPTQPSQDGIAWDCRASSFQKDDLFFGGVRPFSTERFKQAM